MQKQKHSLLFAPSTVKLSTMMGPHKNMPKTPTIFISTTPAKKKQQHSTCKGKCRQHISQQIPMISTTAKRFYTLQKYHTLHNKLNLSSSLFTSNICASSFLYLWPLVSSCCDHCRSTGFHHPDQDPLLPQPPVAASHPLSCCSGSLAFSTSCLNDFHVVTVGTLVRHEYNPSSSDERLNPRQLMS